MTSQMRAKLSENIALISAMDMAAQDLLQQIRPPEGAPPSELNLDDKLALFGHVAKWVAIRHRVSDGEGDGSGLAGYKNAIKGPAVESGGRARKDAAASRIAAAATTGSGLAALKQRLPDASAGDHDRAVDGRGGHTGGPPRHAVINTRGIRIGMGDDSESRSAQVGGDPDL